MLRCNDGLDDIGEVIDVGQGLDTENDIVKGC